MYVVKVPFEEFQVAMKKIPEGKGDLDVTELDKGDFYLVYNDNSCDEIGGFNVIKDLELISDLFSLREGIGSLILSQAVNKGGKKVIIDNDSSFLIAFYKNFGFEYVKSLTDKWDLFKFNINWE